MTVAAAMTPAWKPPPGAVVAVELHIDGEDHHERQDELGDDPQDDVEAHRRPLVLARRRGRRARFSSISTAMPAVKMTAVSPSVSKPR